MKKTNTMGHSFSLLQLGGQFFTLEGVLRLMKTIKSLFIHHKLIEDRGYELEMVAK